MKGGLIFKMMLVSLNNASEFSVGNGTTTLEFIRFATNPSIHIQIYMRNSPISQAYDGE